MSDFVKDNFVSVTSRDFFETMCGKELGEGVARKVYQLSLTPTFVIKFESVAHSFQNIIEYDIWDRIKYTEHAKWFAPCEHISPCGTVLIQRFAKDIEDESMLPTELPVYLTDIKKSNFGVIDGRVVCRDYGVNLLVEKGLSKKLKRVEW